MIDCGVSKRFSSQVGSVEEARARLREPFPRLREGFVLYVGGPIELVGGTLVMLGLFTRPAAFLCSGMMAAAYWMAHGPRALLPIVNQGELAVIYCFGFLYISARGGGIWSVDAGRGG